VEAGHHEYHIIINGRERTVTHDVLTFNQVVVLANYPPPKDGVEYQVTYEHAVSPKHAGDMIQGETVTVKNGTKFVVEPGNRS